MLSEQEESNKLYWIKDEHPNLKRGKISFTKQHHCGKQPDTQLVDFMLFFVCLLQFMQGLNKVSV